jgi:predicted membrane-bound dolichyl-phosphate-mannose-protein mannosyltransferase
VSIKQVHVCDGCGKILTKISEIYYLNLTTDEFWDTTETDYLQEHFEFCLDCAKDIKKTLEKIALKKD